MYSHNKLGIWETSLPCNAQIDWPRAALSAGADLMNQLQAVLDELHGLRQDLRERRDVAELVTAATPSAERPTAWIGEIPKEQDAGQAAGPTEPAT